jgi:hypothetical protein
MAFCPSYVNNSNLGAGFGGPEAPALQLHPTTTQEALLLTLIINTVR